ncbi:MAG: hypothetical protein ACK5MY_02610 [Jhaorihella sp.]
MSREFIRMEPGIVLTPCLISNRVGTALAKTIDTMRDGFGFHLMVVRIECLPVFRDNGEDEADFIDPCYTEAQVLFRFEENVFMCREVIRVIDDEAHPAIDLVEIASIAARGYSVAAKFRSGGIDKPEYVH